MIAFWFLVNFVFFAQYALCRDFYIGFMYHPNATLVAQDLIYKAANPWGYATASYGRLFKCEISYFRVADRLGIGKGPYTKVVRGGIGKKYIAVRITSTYKLPISVNIYVACVKKQKITKGIISTTPITMTYTPDGKVDGNTTDGNGTASNVTDTDTSADNSTASNNAGGGDATTVSSGGGGGDTTVGGETTAAPE